MNKYLVVLLGLFALNACEQNVRDCYDKGCRIPGERYYLIENALVFRSMPLCKQQIKEKTKEYNIQITHATEELKDELYTAGGYGPQQEDYLFLCKQRIHQKGVIFYFGNDQKPVAENASP
jgi:hypothetical protein